MMETRVSADARRQVYELTPSDLKTFPVWEFASDEEDVDGQDEATVRPYLKTPVDPGDGLQVVRATFKLADGTRLLGFVSPPPPATPWGIGNQQPAIVSDGGQVRLFFGIFAPSAAELNGFFEILGKSALEIFPLEYATDVEIIGGPVEGVVAGFAYLKNGVVETVQH
jgi:hypothetical protein